MLGYIGQIQHKIVMWQKDIRNSKQNSRKQFVYIHVAYSSSAIVYDL